MNSFLLGSSLFLRLIETHTFLAQSTNEGEFIGSRSLAALIPFTLFCLFAFYLIRQFRLKAIPLIISILAVLISLVTGFNLLLERFSTDLEKVSGAILVAAATLGSIWLSQLFLHDKEKDKA